MAANGAASSPYAIPITASTGRYATVTFGKAFIAFDLSDSVHLVSATVLNEREFRQPYLQVRQPVFTLAPVFT